jgi:multidrug efflux pump subunit AcrA (membrane-fusion protein)
MLEKHKFPLHFSLSEISKNYIRFQSGKMCTLSNKKLHFFNDLTMSFYKISGFSTRLALFFLWSGIMACGGNGEKKEEAISYQGAPAQATEVVGIGRVEPEQDIISLASNDGGIVSRLNIREGDAVRNGTVLLELESSVASARVSQVRARMATQEAQVTADEKAEAEAQIRLENIGKNARRVQKLFETRVETEQNKDNADFEVRNQQAACERLRAAAQVSRTRLQELRSELAVAERELALRSVLTEEVNCPQMQLPKSPPFSLDVESPNLESCRN